MARRRVKRHTISKKTDRRKVHHRKRRTAHKKSSAKSELHVTIHHRCR